MSLQSIPEHIKKTSSQIHVSDRIDWFFKLNTSRLLAVTSAPHVLDSFHMPLIDKNNDLFVVVPIYFVEKILVFLINEDSFARREHQFKVFYEPVKSILIKHCLCHCFDSIFSYHFSKTLLLGVPFGADCFDPFVEKLRNVKPCFME